MSKSFVTTFTYECEVAYNSSSGKSYDILKEGVKYIYIDHDYQNKIMPIIYMRLNVKPDIYAKMVPDQGKGKIYFKLYRKRVKGSTSSTAKKVIYDEFDYFMTDDPNAYKILDQITNSAADTSYKQCYIGLIKLDLQVKNRKMFEGVYRDTNIISLVQAATYDQKMVIQPFKNNTNIKEFICPTCTSVGQFISYLNEKYSFYKGSYIYYMDFDKTYLRSNDGSFIDAKDGDYKYIAFDIRDLTAYQALSTGMVEDRDQDAYVIYVPGTDAQIIIDRVTSSLVGEISTVSREGSITGASRVNTKKITNIYTPTAVTQIISSDPKSSSYAATKIAEISNTLIITKVDMDSRVFTPNKQYLLSNYEDNPKYCGVYYMTSKKEIYLRAGNKMNCQMTITMKKCADYI